MRNESNYRIYDDAHVERLRFIRHCRSLDMSLDETRFLLNLREKSAKSCDGVDTLLDGQLGPSGWLEIFPAHVSKSQAAQWLRHELASHHGASMALGNDYNDSDLLAWADTGFVVKSAPESLKAHHTQVSDPREAGFSEAFAHWQQSFNKKVSS